MKQVAYYHDGVGTDDNKIMKMIGGAVGIGLNRIIRELYIFLVNNYEPGDRVYLFGFSRGSYTVRLLAGMITTFGILRKTDYSAKSDQDLKRDVETLLSRYKKWQREKRKNPASQCNTSDISTYEGSCEVHFIGVWDTVDAYGIPSDLLARVIDKAFNTSFRYHDRKLSPKVLTARHALAIDDQRRVFQPVLWEEPKDSDHTRIQQVWFSGTHSNVGGGYPKQGMAWTSLEWMMQEAQAAGLYFDPGDIRQFSENKDVHDRLYNSRSGLAAYYAYKVRDICQLVNESTTDQDAKKVETAAEKCEIKPRIHISVFDRIMRRTQEYSPNNIPPTFQIIDADNDEKSILALAKLYRVEGKQNHDAAEQINSGLLAFIRRYSAYITFWSQLAVIAYFLRNSSGSNFTWPALGITLFASFAIWFAVWVCVRTVEKRENRHYSTFWRGLIGKVEADS